MAWTSDDLVVLEKAIATGATSVEYADKKVQYRSLEEMLKVRDMIRDELGLNGEDPSNAGRKYASFSKGLK